jgi:predicted NUDIX family NTP pyrophosphohydrolase
MKKYRNQKGKERLTDAITYRISASQRSFLERLSDKRNVGLCEAARFVLDEAMARAGAEI